MAVDSAFISSVQGGFEDVRTAAAAAVRELGMHADMAEQAPASAASPRRALLDRVADADVIILILGPRYGEPGESGYAPTEDEYNEAMRLGKDVLVFVQEGEMEPAQREFRDWIAPGWDAGRLFRPFRNASDIGQAVIAALAALRAGGGAEDPAAAADRVREFLEEDSSRESSGLRARAVYAPLRGEPLLDPLALEDDRLGDDLSQLLRGVGLVTQSQGIETNITAAGVELSASDARSWATPGALVDAQGVIVVTGEVASDGMLGGMVVDGQKVEHFLGAAGAFARGAWQRIDQRGTVARVAVGAAVLDASMKAWGEGETGSSVSGGMGLPEVVVAPDPVEVIPIAQADSPEVVRRIVAALKRVFIDAGAVHG